MLAAGVTAWLYNKLAHTNGNAVPRNNLIAASIAGIVVFLFMWSLTSLVFDF